MEQQTDCRHEYGRLMIANIMTTEAWNNSMGRTARCVRCGHELRGYEAAMAIKGSIRPSTAAQ